MERIEKTLNLRMQYKEAEAEKTKKRKGQCEHFDEENGEWDIYHKQVFNNELRRQRIGKNME